MLLVDIEGNTSAFHMTFNYSRKFLAAFCDNKLLPSSSHLQKIAYDEIKLSTILNYYANDVVTLYPKKRTHSLR